MPLVKRLVLWALCVSTCAGCADPPVSATITPVKAAAVKRILDGTIKPNTFGMVNLPADLAEASVDQRAYISPQSPAGTVIALPAWRGKGRNFIGFVFCEKDVAEGVLKQNVIGPWVDRQNDRYAGPVEVDILRQVEPHWFEVRFQDD